MKETWKQKNIDHGESRPVTVIEESDTDNVGWTEIIHKESKISAGVS